MISRAITQVTKWGDRAWHSLIPTHNFSEWQLRPARLAAHRPQHVLGFITWSQMAYQIWNSWHADLCFCNKTSSVVSLKKSQGDFDRSLSSVKLFNFSMFLHGKCTFWVWMYPLWIMYFFLLITHVHLQWWYRHHFTQIFQHSQRNPHRTEGELFWLSKKKRISLYIWFKPKQCWKFLSPGRPRRSGLGLGDLFCKSILLHQTLNCQALNKQRVSNAGLSLPFSQNRKAICKGNYVRTL